MARKKCNIPLFRGGGGGVKGRHNVSSRADARKRETVIYFSYGEYKCGIKRRRRGGRYGGGGGATTFDIAYRIGF